MNTHHHVAVRVALGSPRPVSSVPRVPAVGSLPSSPRRAWCMYVYALVCLCGYTRVPPAMPSAQIPGQGVLTAVPVGSRPSLCPFCVHLPPYHFAIRTSFWPPQSRASVLLSRLPAPHLQSRSESLLLPILCTLATCLFFSQYLCHRCCFVVGGKCTQNGHSVAGRGVRPECRDHGPGARIPCPKDRFRRRLSPTGVCNCL